MEREMHHDRRAAETVGEAAGADQPLDAGDSTIIRVATREDVDGLLDLHAQFHAESPFSAFAPINTDRIIATLLAMIEADDARIFVLLKERQIVGALGCMLTTMWFSDAIVCQELFFFIKPEARVPAAASGLIAQTEEWAQRNGALAMALSSIENESRRGVSLFYRRRGYTSAEETFVKEL